MKTNKRLINKLIYELAPLNNKYRSLVKSKDSGLDILELMWEAGDIFKRNNVKKIHPLAWSIYGKSRGIRRSNITRDFLSYCFRIRNFFPQKKLIRQNYYNLKKYSTFREAFPLLENKKYKLKNKKDVDQLNTLLNSSDNPSRIKSFILKLKKKTIGISNPRTQRLKELEPESRLFAEVYKKIQQSMVSKDAESLKSIRNELRKEDGITLNQLLLSLTQEGLKFPTETTLKHSSGDFSQLYKNLFSLTTKNIEIRNRFRRLVPPAYLLNMSQMIIALYDNEELGILKNSF